MILIKTYNLYLIVESLSSMKISKEMPFKGHTFNYISEDINMIEWVGEETQKMDVPEKFRERLTSSDEQIKYMTLELLIQELNKKYDI